MYTLIGATVESSSQVCAVIAVDVLHNESGRTIGARVYLGRAPDEIAIDGYEAHGVDEHRELEAFLRSVRDELEARCEGEAEGHA
jgi:hypothetical protein